jgi:hypothetical protein
MQTFLPFPEFSKSAAVLDYRRLGKQRVECKQILKACLFGGPWENHPAVRMWRGYEGTLLEYYANICVEWKKRGYKHNMEIPVAWRQGLVFSSPPWLGNPKLHYSHQRALLYKNLTYYWDRLPNQYVPISYEYFWPVNMDGSLNE